MKKISVAQPVLFLFVGVITLVIDVVTTSFAFRTLGLDAFISSAIGFFVGFVFNFPANRNRVFSVRDRDHIFTSTQQVVLFLTLAVANILTTSFIIDVLVGVSVPIEIAKIVVTAGMAVWNFFILKYGIFRFKKVDDNRLP